MNSSLPSPQNYSSAHSAMAGLGNPISGPTEGPKEGPNDITKQCFPFLTSVKSLWPKIILPDGSRGCDGISQISKLIFDLQQKIEHIRS